MNEQFEINRKLLNKDGEGKPKYHGGKLADTRTAPFVKDELIRVENQSGSIALVTGCTGYGPSWTVNAVWHDGPNKGKSFSIFNKSVKELDLITRLGFLARDKGTGDVMTQEAADADADSKQEGVLIECDICGGDIIYVDLLVFDRLMNDPRDDCTCDEGEERPRADQLAEMMMDEVEVEEEG